METVRKTHPMIVVAAASVTLLSLAGVASLAGWMPAASHATSATTATLAAATKTEAPATISLPAGTTITVEPKATPRPASSRSNSAPRPPVVASADSSPPGYTRVSSGTTAPVSDNGIYVENARPAANPSPAPTICQSCGTIQSVQEISNKGEGTGLGAIAGGVLGGLLGSQIGGGNGKKAMAVVGAAGGAFAGHEVEKRVRGETQYQISVRFDDGSTRTYTETTATQLQSGDRVRLENGRLVML
ncbi:MAG: glycine zipper 2TM domain-containing protein [Rhodocyclaceae bacterium]